MCSAFCTHNLFIIYLYSNNWLVCITDGVCLLRGKEWIFNPLSPVVTICTTSLTFGNSAFCPHSVFMCFVWIWEQTAIVPLYIINWLVHITETECLLRGMEWIFNPLSPVLTLCTTSLTFGNSPFCPHSVFVCFVWISEQTAVISLYSINWLVFITETGDVYCEVRNGSLNIIQVNLCLYKGLCSWRSVTK